MTYVIAVSSGYSEAIFGPWKDEALAGQVAGRWNRVFQQRGWKLTASVRGLMDKSAGARDRVGAMLIEMAERSREDEALRVAADPCGCRLLDVVPDSATELFPDGMCTCGHGVDEHADSFTCDGMVLPEREGAEHTAGLTGRSGLVGFFASGDGTLSQQKRPKNT